MEHVRIDVTGASEGGFSLMGVFGVLYKLLITALGGALASIPGVLSEQIQYALAAYGLALLIWVWWAFVWPRRAQAKVRAYDHSLGEIRRALRKHRGVQRARHAWLAINFIAAAVIASAGIVMFTRVYAEPAAFVALLFAANGMRLWSDKSSALKTLLSWGLVAAVWYGCLTLSAVIFRDQLDEQGWPAAVAYGGFLLSLGVAIYVSRRITPWSQATMEEMRARDPRPPVLFLRSFDDESRRITDQGGPNLERVLTDAVRPYGPFIGIGRPGELRPSGAAREYFPDHAWQGAVLKLMDEAGLIVVMPGLTKGLDWEMQRLAEHGRLRKTIFVFPPSSGPDRYERLRAVLAETPEGAQLRQVDLSAAMTLHLTRDWRWAVAHSGFVSYAEYQAALDVAVFGLLCADIQMAQ